jgi:hypothetical protein
VTAIVPPTVGITVGGGALAVVVGCGVVVATEMVGGEPATVVGGGAAVVVATDGAPGSTVVGGAEATPGVATDGIVVGVGVPGFASSVVDETANGASARSTSRGDTTVSTRAVMPDSTRLTAAQASPLVTTVPRIHAPVMAIRVRT